MEQVKDDASYARTKHKNVLIINLVNNASQIIIIIIPSFFILVCMYTISFNLQFVWIINSGMYILICSCLFF